MKLKKLIALTCTFVMAASLLTGCGSSKKSSEVLNEIGRAACRERV